MKKNTFSIIEFNWEQTYGKKEEKSASVDYYGKLFVKEHEPFRFMGTAVMSDNKTMLPEKLILTNRFYEEVEKEWQKDYMKAIEEEVRAKANIFL